MNRRKFIKTLGLSAVVLPVVSMLGESKPKVIYTDGNIDCEPWEPIDNPDFETSSDRDAFKEWTCEPMIGSVTDVNGCTVVRIEQGDKVSYFSDVDNIDEKAFTDWAKKENLHWDDWQKGITWPHSKPTEEMIADQCVDYMGFIRSELKRFGIA